jgi:hypothetical protein
VFSVVNISLVVSLLPRRASSLALSSISVCLKCEITVLSVVFLSTSEQRSLSSLACCCDNANMPSRVRHVEIKKTKRVDVDPVARAKGGE